MGQVHEQGARSGSGHQAFELVFVLVGEIVDGRFRSFRGVGGYGSTLNHASKGFILTLEYP